MIIESGIKHVAYFWFAEKESKDEALKLVQEMAAAIPNVGDVRIGGPVDHDWPAWKIDKSWDLAFIVSFRTVDECREYFHHPVHQRNAKRLTELSDKVFANYIQY
ncbi:Dabb family protein [Pseudonocardia halophobica]|uniref:Dabb family protein n=1 Tax=Pseudonocardia halophobica TaxID=29401 RepID=UPI003D9116CC